MKLYELVLIFKTSLSEEKRKKTIETIKGWLKNAKITKEDVWGQKPLAYVIKKELNGYYIKLLLEIESVSPDFEKKLSNNEDVIRHLFLRKDKYGKKS